MLGCLKQGAERALKDHKAIKKMLNKQVKDHKHITT